MFDATTRWMAMFPIYHFIYCMWAQKNKNLHTTHTFFHMYLFLKMLGDLAVGFTCVSPDVGLFCRWGEVMRPRSTVILLV